MTGESEKTNERKENYWVKIQSVGKWVLKEWRVRDRMEVSKSTSSWLWQHSTPENYFKVITGEEVTSGWGRDERERQRACRFFLFLYVQVVQKSSQNDLMSQKRKKGWNLDNRVLSWQIKCSYEVYVLQLQIILKPQLLLWQWDIIQFRIEW